MARWIVRETVTLLYNDVEADTAAEAVEKLKSERGVREFDEVDCTARDTTYKIVAELDTDQD